MATFLVAGYLFGAQWEPMQQRTNQRDNDMNQKTFFALKDDSGDLIDARGTIWGSYVRLELMTEPGARYHGLRFTPFATEADALALLGELKASIPDLVAAPVALRLSLTIATPMENTP